MRRWGIRKPASSSLDTAPCVIPWHRFQFGHVFLGCLLDGAFNIIGHPNQMDGEGVAR